jgi:sulfur carrier protein ThiS
MSKLKLKVILSPNLKAILADKPTEMIVEIHEPLSIKELLFRIGINPRVVLMVVVNGTVKNKNYQIEEDGKILLFGPLAGG